MVKHKNKLQQIHTLCTFYAFIVRNWLARTFRAANKPIAIERVVSATKGEADKIRIGKHVLSTKDVFRAYHLAMDVEMSEMQKRKYRVVARSKK